MTRAKIVFVPPLESAYRLRILAGWRAVFLGVVWLQKYDYQFPPRTVISGEILKCSPIYVRIVCAYLCDFFFAKLSLSIDWKMCLTCPPFYRLLFKFCIVRTNECVWFLEIMTRTSRWWNIVFPYIFHGIFCEKVFIFPYKEGKALEKQKDVTSNEKCRLRFKA